MTLDENGWAEYGMTNTVSLHAPWLKRLRFLFTGRLGVELSVTMRAKGNEEATVDIDYIRVDSEWVKE